MHQQERQDRDRDHRDHEPADTAKEIARGHPASRTGAETKRPGYQGTKFDGRLVAWFPGSLATWFRLPAILADAFGAVDGLVERAKTVPAGPERRRRTDLALV